MSDSPALGCNYIGIMKDWIESIKSFIEFVKDPTVLTIAVCAILVVSINFWVLATLIWFVGPCFIDFSPMKFWQVATILVIMAFTLIMLRSPGWLKINWDKRKVDVGGLNNNSSITLVGAHIMDSPSLSVLYFHIR